MKNVVSILVYRDYLEIKNNPKKLIYVLIAAFIPVLAMFSKQPTIINRDNLFLFSLITVPVYISMESTLNQNIEYIREGVLEQYFINKRIRKYQIVIAKWVTNTVLSIASYILTGFVVIVIMIIRKFELVVNFQYWWIICILLMAGISSSIGLIASTIIKTEKAFCLYMLGMLIIIVPIFKILDYIKVSNICIVGYLSIIGILSIVVINKLFKSNHFINRD